MNRRQEKSIITGIADLRKQNEELKSKLLAMRCEATKLLTIAAIISGHESRDNGSLIQLREGLRKMAE